MKERSNILNSPSSKKEKIRERYKGIDPDDLDIIPAVVHDDFYKNGKEQHVAVYVRVSTDDPRQTTSYELQKNHYEDFVNQEPGWKLIKIYADQGISGTSMEHREAFLNMVEDCEAGKIDMIITKSVSRFARNLVDCISCVRKLKSMTPPVDVYFETERLHTLSGISELVLSNLAIQAQEESHLKSDIMNASIEMRFRRGIFLTPPLLGYDQDENGNLVINEEEADTVRLIYFMYLYGYSCSAIAKILTELGKSTKLGNKLWSPSSVLGILTNERHCGDVLARKTYTPDFLDHKAKKNCQNRPQYRQRNHHEAIICRDDFIAVQHLIANAKYGNGNKGILPELHVIAEGILKGYVLVNPRWAAFKAEDYQKASQSIADEKDDIKSNVVTIKAGNFDLHGYEVARAQFFDTLHKISITISCHTLTFRTKCVRMFEEQFVELLVHPKKQTLVVRPVTEKTPNAVQWSKAKKGSMIPREIGGAAFLPNLYTLFGWDMAHKYRILGVKKQNGAERILLFHLEYAERLVATKDKESLMKKEAIPITNSGMLFAYSNSWANTFGKDFYEQYCEEARMLHTDRGRWFTQSAGISYNPDPLQITSTEEIKNHIEAMIGSAKLEETNE